MLPEKFTEQMKKLLGGDFDNFIKAMDAPAVKGLRINGIKSSCEAIISKFADGIVKLPYGDECYRILCDTEGIGNTPLHKGGAFYIQDPGAMIAVAAASHVIKEGMRCADLCAAPGGKTSQLSALLGDGGFLLSNEFVPKRAKILVGNIERLGIRNTAVCSLDTKELAREDPDAFDFVLTDAPCSGEGMFRKGEVAITEWSPEATVACADRQREILDNAAKMVAGGGYLLYSTCTYNSKENEEQVDGFLERHPDFSLIPVSDSVLSSSTPGILFDGALHEELYLCRRFYPHISDGEGQFVALMKREDKGKTPVGKADKKREKKPEQIPPTVLDFLRDNLTAIPDGNIKMHGENAVLHTHDIPLPSHGVFLSGILLGEVKGKNLFPSYQLFSALGHLFKRRIELSKEDAIRYLKGEELECSIPEMRGFATICYLGVTLGGGKISDGRIKNHYPKGLRLLG